MLTKQRNRVVSAEDFIDAWMRSESYAEVAVRLGINVKAVYQRVSRWRKQGINLPQMSTHSGRRKLEIEALNNLIDSYGRE